MTVGIVGLGLIGGSFAKAYHAAGWTVYGYDVDESMLAFAQLADAVNVPLTMENIGTCDLVLLCVRPLAAINYLRSAAPHIGSRPVVIDCCGTKRVVCEACFPLAEQYGFTYLGGHPMAGTHNSGFKYATATMYHGAPMVLVPADIRWPVRSIPGSATRVRICITMRRWSLCRRILTISSCLPAHRSCCARRASAATPSRRRRSTTK